MTSSAAPPPAPADTGAGHAALNRSVGFYGLMFVSLGSIIGSGWLLGALNAAEAAGPASIISWILAAVMLTSLALVYAELGAAYPVAGGSGRYPYYSHGPVAGFAAGWASWLQAVSIAPIEIEASITYVTSVHWIHQHFDMLKSDGSGNLNGRGIVVAVIAMFGFTILNLAGAKFMAESNSIVVIWKTLVPLLAIIVVASLSFHTGNFSAGGGFAPHGFHGIFAAFPAGVVFALQGFEQAVQLAGEARDPKKDLSRAVITAMMIGAVLYSLLQLAFIAGVEPKDVAKNWSDPLAGSNSTYGAWYVLALAVGASWLGTILIIDAVVSPAGTGIVYVGTSSRLSFALGEETEMPSALASVDSRGVPVVSIILSLVVGLACFAPFPSWKSLVGVVTGFTAIMYGFAPVSLAALRKVDPNRQRSYTMPAGNILMPFSFVAANLILYWGGYDVTIKIAIAMIFGLILFGIGTAVQKTDSLARLKPAIWVAPWIIGNVIIGLAGRYQASATSAFKAKDWLPNWVDLLVVIVFNLVMFYWAVNSAHGEDEVAKAIERDKAQLEFEEATLRA